jgi:mannose-6-phosphate isomerase-like protein (cupin superfamily)
MKSARNTLVTMAALVLSVGLLPYGHAQGNSSPSPVYIEHQKVEAMFAVPCFPPGFTGQRQGCSIPIPDFFATENYKVRVSRHYVPGPVEFHKLDTDIVYVTSGEATLVVGGTGINMKQMPNDANELKGTDLKGGTAYQLRKGDMMIVPSGIPHWYKAITSAPFLFVEVKVR